MSRFQFVADHQDAFEVKQLCAAVQIARSSFYAWQQAAAGRAERAAADAVLAHQIRAVHNDDKTYGAPRVTAELNDGAAPQARVNHKRIARVMKQHRIAGVRLRRRVRTTIPEASDQRVPDLVKRDFTAPVPNRRYVGDITYLPLASGKNLYLATVIDCYSRRLAGWAIAEHMRTDLITTALRDAANTRGTLTGAVFHADHGAQGGLNRSSQHLMITEVSDGATATTSGPGSSARDAVTWPAYPGQARGAGVLAPDREGQVQRRCRAGGRRVGAGGGPLVSSRWRHVAPEPGRAERPLLVVPRT